MITLVHDYPEYLNFVGKCADLQLQTDRSVTGASSHKWSCVLYNSDTDHRFESEIRLSEVSILYLLRILR